MKMHEVSYGLTERLCKDLLEKNFDKQSFSGGYKDNLTLYDYSKTSETKKY